MIEKDEMFSGRKPKRNIICKDCAFRLKPVEIQGETIERHTYGECLAFKTKPLGILWNGESCELYTKE